MSGASSRYLLRERRRGPNRLILAQQEGAAERSAPLPHKVPRQLPSSAVDALCDAASCGNQKRVREQLAKGVRVNDSDVDGITALMAASFAGKVQVVKLLLRQGAEVDLQDESGQTALMNAVIGSAETVPGTPGARHDEVIGLLLDAGANPSIRDAARFTALDYALVHHLHELTDRLAID